MLETAEMLVYISEQVFCWAAIHGAAYRSVPMCVTAVAGLQFRDI